YITSRRRHTRFSRDWSSDVCSSDLMASMKICTAQLCFGGNAALFGLHDLPAIVVAAAANAMRAFELKAIRARHIAYGRKRVELRSEERRVGKERRKRVTRDNKQ